MQQTLVERAACGDAAAFDDLVGLASPRLFGVAQRILRDRHLAEDVLQGTLITAGLLAGAVVAVLYPSPGPGIVLFCAAMLLTTRFAVMDRLFGRRQARSLIGRTIELSLGDDSILWDGPLATARIPWPSITEVRAKCAHLAVRWRQIGPRLCARPFRSSQQMSRPKSLPIHGDRSRPPRPMAARASSDIHGHCLRIRPHPPLPVVLIVGLCRRWN